MMRKTEFMGYADFLLGKGVSIENKTPNQLKKEAHQLGYNWLGRVLFLFAWIAVAALYYFILTT